MRLWKSITAFLLMACFLGAPLGALAAEEKKSDPKKAQKTEKKLKPYLLKSCAVSDEELGSMGDPFVFEHKGREIKLCCKSCQKDFKKNPTKFIKKVEKAEKKLEKKS